MLLKILYVSPGAKELIGYSSRELENKNLAEMVHGEFTARPAAALMGRSVDTFLTSLLFSTSRT